MVLYPCIKTYSSNTKYCFSLHVAWKKIKLTVDLSVCTYLCYCLYVWILLRNIKYTNLLLQLLGKSGFPCCLLLVSCCSWNWTLIFLLFWDCWMRILLFMSCVTLYCACREIMSHPSQRKTLLQCMAGSLFHLMLSSMRGKCQKLCWNPPLSFVACCALCRDLGPGELTWAWTWNEHLRFCCCPVFIQLWSQANVWLDGCEEEPTAFWSNPCYFNFFTSLMVVDHVGNAGLVSLCFGFISTRGILDFLVFIALGFFPLK